MDVSTTLPLTRRLILHGEDLPSLSVISFHSLPLQQLPRVCSSCSDTCCAHVNMPEIRAALCWLYESSIWTSKALYGLSYNLSYRCSMQLMLTTGCAAQVMITIQSAISCMSLWTTMQILQVCRPHSSCRISAAQSTLLDIGQNRRMDRQRQKQTDRLRQTD